MNKTKKILLIALALILVAAIGASLVQSAFGQIKVSTKIMSLTEIADAIRANNAAYGKKVEISFTESTTAEIQFKVLVPKNASESNPVPAIITCHGAYNNKEMQNINYIEMARRGFVVISIDGNGHGRSDFSVGALTHESNGIEAIAEYAMSLPFVDETQIGVTGHSWGNSGCVGAINSINLNTSNHIAAFLQGQGSLYCTSMQEEATKDLLWGFMVGKYDEMDTVWWNAYTITTSDWAKGWIQTIDPGFNGSEVPLGVWFSADGSKTVPEGTRFDGTEARVLYNPPTTHPGAHFSISGCATYLTFFYGAFGVPNGASYIPVNQQIWYLMVAFTLLGLLSWYMLAFPLIELLLSTPLFSRLRGKQKDLSEMPSIRDWRQWVPLALLVLFLILFGTKSIIPLVEEGKQLFPSTPFLPVDGGQANNFILWSLVCGIVAMLALVVVFFVKRLLYRKDGAEIVGNPFAPAAISGSKMLLSFLFVACLMAILYVPIFLIDKIFQVDFRICAYQVMSFKLDRIPLILRYTCLFGVFYFANALLVANTRFKDMPKWTSAGIVAFGNVIGIIVLLFIEYHHLMTYGVLRTSNEGIIFIVLYSYLCPMILAPFIARYCEEKTGNIWVGASFNALLFTSAMVSNARMLFDITLLGI